MNTRLFLEPDLKSTLADLVLLPPERVLCHGADWSARPRPTPAAPQSRYPTGLHAHGYPELCLVLQGVMRMDVMTRRYVLAAPALALLTPGLEHCEAWHRPDQPYRVLWLVLVRTGAFARAIHYQPGQGWIPGARRRVLNPAVTTLYDLLTQRDRTLDLADYEVLRADLLAILAAMHHEQIHKRLAPSPAASPAALRPELDHVLNLLDRNWRRPITVRQLAQLARMAPNYLNRLFRQRTGRSIHRYLTDRRMAEALRLCRERTLSVKEVAAKVGYDDPLYFSRAFRRFHGRPPSEA